MLYKLRNQTLANKESHFTPKYITVLILVTVF